MSPEQSQREADASHSPTADPTPSSPPPAPVPSEDPKLGQAQSPSRPDALTPGATSEILSKISPAAALKLLCANAEFLVEMTGDVPPTPPQPQARGHMRHMSDLARERVAIARSHSQQNLARQRELAEGATVAPTNQEAVDGVQLRQNPAAPNVAEANSTSSAPMVVIGANSQPTSLQHDALTRWFYSKKRPPITIEDYLARIHKFCPMSTAVYLTTSLFLTRLAVEERVVMVTHRSCHRLILAGLRVAMKALEDHSYAHLRICQVGGVSPRELTRLELGFCFLADFQLQAGPEALEQHYEALRNTQAVTARDAGGRPEPVPGLRLDPARIRNQVTPAG